MWSALARSQFLQLAGAGSLPSLLPPSRLPPIPSPNVALEVAAESTPALHMPRLKTLGSGEVK